METKNFKFDDERGNNFNITVNHYHSAEVQNPMSGMLNMIGQAMMTNAMMNLLDNKPNMIEEEKRYLPKNAVLIDEKPIDDVEYEIHDYIKYEFTIENMHKITRGVNSEDITKLEISFEETMTFDIFTIHYKEIFEDIKHKLSVIGSGTSKFIVSFKIINIGTIYCAYIDTNYFSALIKKFGNGKKRVFFNHSIGEKINVPYLSYLSDLDFIIDLEGLYKINYEAIDNKYHISKEGE